ncbi:MAG: hypothetical protein LBL41_01525 [Bifidobacteriaceae bacterium]|jgi:MinD-like ATPase involved in chromosome partitioning or flagellar assembly|nr:hypothetical protein [Bifidobacteriaceae bacterium]
MSNLPPLPPVPPKSVGTESVDVVRIGAEKMRDEQVFQHKNASLAVVAGIVGATGGIGASSLTVSLAKRAAELGFNAIVVDLQVARPIDFLCGAESEEGLRWQDLNNVEGEIDAMALKDRLVVKNGISILTNQFDSPEPARQVSVVSVIKALRFVADFIFVDLPKEYLAVSSSEVAKLLDNLIILTARNLEGVVAASALRNLQSVGEKNKKQIKLVTLYDKKNAGNMSLTKTKTYIGDYFTLDLEYDAKIKKQLSEVTTQFGKKTKYRKCIDTILNEVSRNGLAEHN